MDHILDKLMAEKKGPCLSVIIPQHRLSREKMQNPEILRKAVRKARSLLNRKRLPSIMVENLDKLTMQFASDYAIEGLGMFISPRTAELVGFPFPVNERIIVDSSFETRDLLYLKQLSAPYCVLVLGRKKISLYSARGDELDEIKDGHFPFVYEEEYEYTRPSLGSSFGYSRKGMAKDKSTMVKVRTQSFFGEAGRYVALFLGKTRLPLIIAGAKSSMSEFKLQPEVAGRISGEVSGSFEEYNFQDLRSKVLRSFIKYEQEEIKNKIREFRENDVPDRVAKGIQEVWTAAQEGRGQVLLVEKDYARPAYLCSGDPVLYLRPPRKKYVRVPDAIDEIIETVLDKGGAVLFTGNNKLKPLDSIALWLRYQIKGNVP
jgi:hypothetical protein